jgi:hypothetical protein
MLLRACPPAKNARHKKDRVPEVGILIFGFWDLGFVVSDYGVLYLGFGAV